MAFCATPTIILAICTTDEVPYRRMDPRSWDQSIRFARVATICLVCVPYACHWACRDPLIFKPWRVNAICVPAKVNVRTCLSLQIAELCVFTPREVSAILDPVVTFAQKLTCIGICNISVPLERWGTAVSTIFKTFVIPALAWAIFGA